MSIAVIAAEPQRQALLPAVRCAAAGHHVTVADSVTGVSPDGLLFAVVDEGHAQALLGLLKESGSKARVLLVGAGLSPGLVNLALAHPRVVGLCGAAGGAPEPWEVTYLTRRVLALADPIPVGSQFMPWGVTNVVWTPKSTSDLRRIVKQIDDIARNLGAERREATTVATAAHELLMNAMYDAPVDESGQPLFAFDRTAEVALSDRQRPTFRFAVSPTYLALDASDPFGRLPRSRFFDGVLRGLSGEAVLDTTHGGAGLGLYTLLTAGSVLRVELRPMRETHVSWMLRRGRARDPDRSMYFVPLPEAR